MAPTSTEFAFDKLREVIGDNTHVVSEFKLPNTVFLKFRNGETSSVSNTNLKRIAEGSAATETKEATEGLGFQMKILMVPNDQADTALPFVEQCNDTFFAALAEHLKATKKAPSAGTSSQGNATDQAARAVIKMVDKASKIGMKLNQEIDMTEEHPEIGKVSIVDGIIDNEYISNIKSKDEENTEKRLAALKAKREADKKAKAEAAEAEAPVEAE